MLKFILKKDMSYGWTCFSGVYIFGDNMSYESICLKERAFVGGNVLWVVMRTLLNEERFY